MEWEYMGRVLTYLEEDSDKALDGLNFIFTDSQDVLPEHDKNTVVFLIGNEQYQIPAYHSEVKCVFANYVKSDCEAGNVYPIPHGIMKGVPRLPYKPMKDRPIDVLFIGWCHGRRGEVLQNLANRLKDRYNIVFSHQNSATLIPSVYGPDYLWNSKICLDLFGGHGPETFRYYESLMYGCATISQTKPRHWVYEESPAIFIDSWFDYDAICKKIEELLADTENLEKIGRQSREYFFWNYDESSVAIHIFHKLLEQG